MKRAAIATLVFAFGTALATASLAQGRHDEKPHGMGKPAAGATEGSGPVMGGRHDERPHGTKKKIAAKKQETKCGAEAGPDASKCGK